MARGEVSCALREEGHWVLWIDTNPQFESDVSQELKNWQYSTVDQGAFQVLDVCIPFGRSDVEGKMLRTLMDFVAYFRLERWGIQTLAFGQSMGGRA